MEPVASSVRCGDQLRRVHLKVGDGRLRALLRDCLGHGCASFRRESVVPSALNVCVIAEVPPLLQVHQATDLSNLQECRPMSSSDNSFGCVLLRIASSREMQFLR